MTGDPYEEAEQRMAAEEARIETPSVAKKSRKLVIVGMVLAGLILALVILANIARSVTAHSSAEGKPLPKPTTMTQQQSDTFAQQQSGQASYLQGLDRNKTLQANEDTVLGQSGNLAADAYAESDGVPKKTKAQDDAEHGRSVPSQGGAAHAETQLGKSALEQQHRRENDIDSSPVAVDFSDYFDKEKPASAASAVATGPTARPVSNSSTVMGVASGRSSPSAFANLLNSEEAQTEAVSRPRDAHDPKDDYTFDSSFGKLYRLMESTVMETVLVNRLASAAAGPVITMVTDDLYSLSGTHLLIPRGTRLLGSVTAVGSTNQERLFVAFHRMIMPDGYSVSLDKFKGLDVVGQSGLRDLVNHHYVQIFGASLALAAISATSQIGNNSTYGTYDWGTQMRSGLSEGLGQNAQRVMQRFLNVLPTFTIRERARVKILLAGDLLLPDTRNHTMDPDL